MGRHLRLLGGEFSPLSISGLQLWLSSRYGSSMLQERSSATTLAASNGDPVGTWQDLSGNGRHLAAGTDAKRPTISAGAQAGKPLIVFDGVDDTLFIENASWLKDLPNVTIIGMVKPAAAATADTNTSGALVVIDNAGAGTQIWIALGGYATGSHTGEKFSTLFTGGSRFCIGPAYSRAANTPEIWAGTFGSSGQRFYQNGTNLTIDLANVGNQDSACGPSTATISTPRLTLSQVSGIAPLVIGELLIYNFILTATQRQQVERYLGAAWGITVA